MWDGEWHRQSESEDREREKERERSLKGKIEKIARGDVLGVSGRTGPLSTTLEEQRRRKKERSESRA